MKTKINTSVPFEYSSQLVCTLQSFCTVSERVRKAYAVIRDHVVGNRRDPEAASKLRDVLHGIVQGQDGVNFETARSVIGQLMRADGLRQRTSTERMNPERKDLIEKVMEAVNELTPESNDRERAALCQAVVRAYQKAAKSDKAAK